MCSPDPFGTHENGEFDVPGLEDISWESSIEMGRNSWAFQELFKGRLTTEAGADSAYGGWGRNYIDYPSSIFNYEEVEINELTVNPFFNKGAYNAWLFTSDVVDENTLTPGRLNQLLANQFPALTLATGRSKTNAILPESNINMSDRFMKRETWPRESHEWLHGDIRAVSFVYTNGVFTELVRLIGETQ